jgi:rubrerythrin
MESTSTSGMKDEHYDIVSALYHALQGADVASKYIDDAEKEGDKEVASFFHEVQDKNRELATKAKELLAKRVH